MIDVVMIWVSWQHFVTNLAAKPTRNNVARFSVFFCQQNQNDKCKVVPCEIGQLLRWGASRCSGVYWTAITEVRVWCWVPSSLALLVGHFTAKSADHSCSYTGNQSTSAADQWWGVACCCTQPRLFLDSAPDDSSALFEATIPVVAQRRIASSSQILKSTPPPFSRYTHRFDFQFKGDCSEDDPHRHRPASDCSREGVADCAGPAKDRGASILVSSLLLFIRRVICLIPFRTHNLTNPPHSFARKLVSLRASLSSASAPYKRGSFPYKSASYQEVSSFHPFLASWNIPASVPHRVGWR